MCLLDVNFTRRGLSRTVHTGYKVFLRVVPVPPGVYADAVLDPNRKLYYPFQRYNSGGGDGIVEFNKWLISVQKKIHSGGMISAWKLYKSGFHIYKNKSDADGIAWSKSEEVVEVKYTGVLADGVELDGRHVVVARRMYVPRKKK